ncbi:MAG: hypothetical protein OXG97_04255 [Candidatus Poribacteria bacterium]|nr:hypothetical protein [Candidatus Poribacteria bacterium]
MAFRNDALAGRHIVISGGCGAIGFLFLCSAAADYMTGTVLLVDGGCSLYPMDDA